MDAAAPLRSVDNLRASLESGVREGVVRVMGASLTQGVFLTGFAAALGADARQMGLISAVATLGMVSQVLGAHVINRVGGRKTVFIAVNIFGGLLWLALGAGAFFLWPDDAFVWGLVAFCALDSVLGATRYVAWIDWLRTLVPASLRGRYFGRRNRTVLLSAMALSIPMAWFVDHCREVRPENPLGAYGIVFMLAGALFLVSTLFARRIEEPPIDETEQAPLRTAARNAWASSPFRRYFLFRMFMNFAMSLAGPLLIFYLISELAYSKTFIATLGVVATLVSAATVVLWGKLSDRVGNRPAIVLVMVIKLVWAALWLFVARDSHLLLLVIYVFSAHGAASVLLHQNMQMKLVPREGAAGALSLFNAITFVPHAIAPVVGGYLVHTGLPREITLSGWTLTNWQQLILISLALRLLCTAGLFWVREPASMPMRHFARLLRRGFTPEQPLRVGSPLPADDEDESSYTPPTDASPSN